MPDNQEHVSLKLAFEPFAKFEQGAPIRVLPEGTWYRGARKLNITKDRLLEIVRNFTEGLPRFRIPINLDHEDKSGKVGTITGLEYLLKGPQGAGVYADAEFTPKGLEAIEENGYDAVSAEVIWTIGGKASMQYQDPETGKLFDNVLVGMALTPQPFFGHQNVALFNSEPSESFVEDSWLMYGGSKTFKEYEQWIAERDERDRVDTLNVVFRELFDNIWNNEEMDAAAKVKKVSTLINEFKQKVKSGAEVSFTARVKEVFGFTETLPDATMEVIAGQIETMASALEPTSDEIIEDEAKEETMADDTQVADNVELSKEEFTALTAKAAQADTHAIEIKRLADEQETREASQRAAELQLQAESYEVLPVEVEEFVANFSAIEAEADATTWFKAQFEAFDAALKAAGALEEIGAEGEGQAGTEDAVLALTDQIIKDEFDGDQSKYAEALILASERSDAKLV